ncbi:MAG: bifunctional (p)ppGpp synthetase/guanosine-3',5'-bis(diphosphate) 3'-pyrophosphohydrolase [Bacilli bacterium]|jgi:GTP pyrophosphokinase|nr:bifunctional (p)ppGpp synthetase/guanosine-3',5'-bis(diphosphate) 3'-pyrophosphohydrolase [Bacilli bacterium]
MSPIEQKTTKTTQPYVNPATGKTVLPNGGYPMHSYQDVRDLYRTYINDPSERKMIDESYLLAEKKHAGVFRKSGEPYIQHPIEVAYILCGLHSGPATIAAGFLHDVVEDTDETIEDIERLFGHEVAAIVDALTKIQRMKLSHRTEKDFEAEDHRKIFLGMAKDVRVILVKLADRLHNMRTLDALKPVRQHALASETLDVFTPIAHRLGIYTIQSELEDLSLKYLEPDKYDEILSLLNEREKNRKESLEALKKRIADILFEHHIKFRMESRVKSIYSIYRKMFKKGYSFDEIYDVLAVRIITETEMNCYEILGIIHSTYKPIPGRFKDYIAMPKPNMYQSLHTTIVSGDGNIYEVQIRTEEMDQIAESGVAAHWRYKEGQKYNAKEEQRDIEEKLHWFRDFVSISGEQSEDAKDYMAALSNDIFNANVYVFTPLGKVIDLPQGSTPLDFAYKIHTKVGDSAVGATVNGINVPLNTTLKTGDVCEIRTSKNSAGPNEGWLDICKTASAKAHIKKALNAKAAEFMAEEDIRKGKESCLESFRNQGIDEGEMEKLLDSDKVRGEYHVRNLDDLYAAVANKNPTPPALIQFLKIRRKDLAPKIERHSSAQDDHNPIVVEGAGNVAVALAKCCTPIPGDEIVGYITRGKGITVHRVNCPNVIDEKQRLIPVKWKEDLGISTYPVDLSIYANDRPGLVADILALLSSKGAAINDLRAHLIQATMNTVVNLTIFVPDRKTLEDDDQALLGVKGVYEIKRVNH